MSYTGPGGEFTLLCPVLLALQETVCSVNWQLKSSEGQGSGVRVCTSMLHGSFQELGVPYFGVLIIRILQFGYDKLGSPIFGKPLIDPK